MLPSKVAEFIRCLATVEKARMPNIRALFKMHKVKVAARLIVANTAWATTPAAIFVATFLQTIVTSFQHVASATNDVVQLVRDYVRTMETSCTRSM